MRQSPFSDISSLDNLDSYQERVSFYSKNMGIEIIFDNHLKAAAGVPDTNGADTAPRIFVNPRLCMEQFGFTPEELLFVLFHEVEHLFEDESVKQKKEDKSIFQEREERFIRQEKIQKGRAEAYHNLENALRDVFVNKQVTSPQKIPALSSTVRPLYHKLFPTTDYLEKNIGEKSIPKHMQFSDSLLREGMLPDEPMILDDFVRKIVTRLQRNGSFKDTTTGGLKKRLKSLWKFVEPSFTRLLNDDIQQREQDKEDGKNGKGQKGEKEGNGQDNEKENPFDERYSAKKQPHILENLDPETIETIKKIIKKALEDQKENKKLSSKEELDIENRIRIARGYKKGSTEFEAKRKSLSEYLSYIKELHAIKDPKTKNSVIQELANCFDAIKARRLKPYYRSKGPVDSEHGVRLHGPSIAEGIGSILVGQDDPYMREKDIVKFKPGEFTNNFELTLITDGSYSMKQDDKNKEQKKACLAIFEGLKLLHDKLQQESDEMVCDLHCTTEGFMFDGKLVHTIKEKGTQFTDPQRLTAFTELDRCNGGNNEDDALNLVKKNILSGTQEYRENVLLGETKKIVIMISDGLGDIEEIKKCIGTLRGLGVFVYGIMLGTNVDERIKREVLSTYQDKHGGKNAYFCKSPADIVHIVYSLLQEHLTIL